MFLLNVGYQWNILDELQVDGAIFRASGQDFESLGRRHRPNGLQRTLFDPQLYLGGYALDPSEHAPLIGKLCTYPWFQLDVAQPPEASGAPPRRQKDIDGRLNEAWESRGSPANRWSQVVQATVETQVTFGCSEIILPSPLLADPEDSLDEYFSLLDEAIDVGARHTQLPLLASVPIDERLVAHRDPASSEVVEALADGLTARRNVAGAYITLSVDASTAVPVLNRKVAGSILRLCRLLGGEAGLAVITNFAEALGLATLGFGGTAYGSGFSVKSRCLRIEDYRVREGGAAYPKFSSIALAVDFSPDPDMESMRDKGLLRYFSEDRTPAGIPLLEALEAGRSSALVPAWERRRNNVSAAKKHYAQNHASWARRQWTQESVRCWLQDAESKWGYVSTRFESAPLTVPDGRHLGPWRSAVDELVG